MSKKQQPGYQPLSNKPISCHFCGETVRGQIVEVYDPKSKQTDKTIRWNCSRCGNVVRVGKPV